MDNLWIRMIINGLVEGKKYRKPARFSHEISWDFPVIFPLNQPIENSVKITSMKPMNLSFYGFKQLLETSNKHGFKPQE